ncbi:hypothetical protein GF377_05065 [candidate division GN15 bacterium]|nr:hypothetical protein [candidate division GN15 bacterium]
MFLLDLIAAIVVALVFTLLMVGVFGWQRPGREGAGSAMLFLFFFLLVIVWAGGVWLEPMGPMLWGIAWIPFFAIGLLAALFVLSLAPPHRPRTRREAIEQAEARAKTRAGAEAALSTFFWLLVALLIIAIIARYVV